MPYIKGSHNITCGVCNIKRKHWQGKLQWNGVWACTVLNCWSPKPVSLYPIILTADSRPVNPARPKPTQLDVDVPESSFDPDSTFPPDIR